jgi:hypothetical protein
MVWGPMNVVTRLLAIGRLLLRQTPSHRCGQSREPSLEAGLGWRCEAGKIDGRQILFECCIKPGLPAAT